MKYSAIFFSLSGIFLSLPSVNFDVKKYIMTVMRSTAFKDVFAINIGNFPFIIIDSRWFKVILLFFPLACLVVDYCKLCSMSQKLSDIVCAIGCAAGAATLSYLIVTSIETKRRKKLETQVANVRDNIIEHRDIIVKLTKSIP
jgi:hypothetical protein